MYLVWFSGLLYLTSVSVLAAIAPRIESVSSSLKFPYPTNLPPKNGYRPRDLAPSSLCIIPIKADPTIYSCIQYSTGISGTGSSTSVPSTTISTPTYTNTHMMTIPTVFKLQAQLAGAPPDPNPGIDSRYVHVGSVPGSHTSGSVMNLTSDASTASTFVLNRTTTLYYGSEFACLDHSEIVQFTSGVYSGGSCGKLGCSISENDDGLSLDCQAPNADTFDTCDPNRQPGGPGPYIVQMYQPTPDFILPSYCYTLRLVPIKVES